MRALDAHQPPLHEADLLQPAVDGFICIVLRLPTNLLPDVLLIAKKGCEACKCVTMIVRTGGWWRSIFRFAYYYLGKKLTRVFGACCERPLYEPFSHKQICANNNARFQATVVLG